MQGAKEPDYETMSREQRTLATIIREHAGGRRGAPLDKLIMRAQVGLGWVYVDFRGHTNPLAGAGTVHTEADGAGAGMGDGCCTLRTANNLVQGLQQSVLASMRGAHPHHQSCVTAM